MRRFADEDEIDLVIVGCGAGGSVLLQRLARAGWRVAALDADPFWDPDTDWVSDEAGSHHLYWTDPRVIAGSDPVPMGSNNSGRGVGGSMVHYAGYTPRFHASDFATRTADGVGADWPLSGELARRQRADVQHADHPAAHHHRHAHHGLEALGPQDRVEHGGVVDMIQDHRLPNYPQNYPPPLRSKKVSRL
jgi:choline dehydrogenase-like flavoprotein